MNATECLFGLALAKERKERGMSQWNLAVAANHHIRNLQYVEKGGHEPGVLMAVKMVAAVGADVGVFFQSLYAEVISAEGIDIQDANVTVTRDKLVFDGPSGVQCVFGPLLRQARVHYGVPQRIVADFAGCQIRHLSRIEKGEQEPGVMRALKMVAATGADIAEFFNALNAVLKR